MVDKSQFENAHLLYLSALVVHQQENTDDHVF